MQQKIGEIDIEARKILASEMMKFLQGEMSIEAFYDAIDMLYSRKIHDILILRSLAYIENIIFMNILDLPDNKFEGDYRLGDSTFELFKQLEESLKTDQPDVPQDLQTKMDDYFRVDENDKEKRMDRIMGIGVLLIILSHAISWVVSYYVGR